MKLFYLSQCHLPGEPQTVEELPQPYSSSKRVLLPGEHRTGLRCGTAPQFVLGDTVLDDQIWPTLRRPHTGTDRGTLSNERRSMPSQRRGCLPHSTSHSAGLSAYDNRAVAMEEKKRFLDKAKKRNAPPHLLPRCLYPCMAKIHDYQLVDFR